MRRKAGPEDSTELVRSLLDRVNEKVAALCDEGGRESINFMEVCGTHTMAISGFGIRKAVDPRLRLLSGPGCPVCVTTQAEIDACIELAQKPGVAVATFGDMMRVPGATGSLEQAKARGAEVKVVYSALDALRLAEEKPGTQFVFLGVGFETTAPTIAAAVQAAKDEGASNFSVFAMFKLIPPALRMIAASDRVNVDGFVLPGHVSVIIGTEPYRFLAEEHGLPSCVTGFEARDVVQGIWMLLNQLEHGAEVAIQYRRTVRPEGNAAARKVLDDVFEPTDAEWREIGMVPGSGLRFRKRYEGFDARRRFGVKLGKARKTGCRCGEVMLGVIVPPECGLFERKCSPENPVGPCMVSSEGACAAYFKYER